MSLQMALPRQSLLANGARGRRIVPVVRVLRGAGRPAGDRERGELVRPRGHDFGMSTGVGAEGDVVGEREVALDAHEASRPVRLRRGRGIGVRRTSVPSHVLHVRLAHGKRFVARVAPENGTNRIQGLGSQHDE
jgi:hypothetical protein